MNPEYENIKEFLNYTIDEEFFKELKKELEIEKEELNKEKGEDQLDIASDLLDELEEEDGFV